MYFTQEDYKKIESWLLKNSIKDSEFQEVLPISGDETVVVTQDGYNRIITIGDLSKKILELGVSDFINVSNGYNAYGISLQEAIALIPYKFRKKGLVITFCNDENTWEIVQFTGALNQWNNTTLWNDIFNIENYMVNSILPDGEDLTRTEPDSAGNSFLKINDKQYNPLEFSGYGKKILRKKLVTVQTSSTTSKRINILERNVLKDSNTIYEIKYDFDLNGSTINIPSNCILYFNGGKISNGKLNLNNTLIYPLGIVKEDVLDCNIEGSYKEGQIFYDIKQDQLSIWDGKSWKSRVNYRIIDNKLNETLDGGNTWTPVSDYISANFRWSPENTIQINRTGKEEDWEDLSYKFANNVFIKGYVANYSALPSNPSLGDIYMVGAGAPYTMYVSTSEGWKDNGQFTSIAAGVVQTTGQSTTEVMSQKAVTDKLTELESEMGTLVGPRKNVPMNTILFTKESVKVGDAIEYSIISRNSTIGFFDSNGNRIDRGDFSEEEKLIEGCINIPEDFSYASVLWGSLDINYVNIKGLSNVALKENISYLFSQGNLAIFDDSSNAFSISTENLEFSINASLEPIIYVRDKAYLIRESLSCKIYSEDSPSSVNYIVYNTELSIIYPKVWESGLGSNEVAIAIVKTTYGDAESKKFTNLQYAGGAVYVDGVANNSIWSLENKLRQNEINDSEKGIVYNSTSARLIGKASFNLELGEHSSTKDVFEIKINPHRAFSLLVQSDAVFDSFYVKLYKKDGTSTNIYPSLNEKSNYIVQDEIIAASAYVSNIKQRGTLSFDFNNIATINNEVDDLSKEVSELSEVIFGETFVSYILADSAEHSSNKDIIDIEISSGTQFEINLLQNGGVCDGTNVYAKLHNVDGTKTNIPITIGNTSVVKAEKDISGISFYLYKITTLGEFKVIIRLFEKGLLHTISHESNEIPSYYDAYLTDRVNSVVNNVADVGNDGISFVFITDTHWNANTKKSPALIKYITDNTSIMDVIFGGDVIDGGDTNEMISLINDFGAKMHAASPRFFACFGNHDVNLNDGGTEFNSEVYYSLVEKYADYLVEMGKLSYFYFDNKTCKTRMVFLDTYKGQGGHTDSLEEQIAWLNNVLQSCPNDYHVVVFQHIYFYDSTDELKPIVSAINNAIDAFNANSSSTKVEAVIAGHMHEDRNVTTPGGIPVILTTCDVEYGKPHEGTINEQAFDVMTIDFKKRLIKCIRIGRGADRVIAY